MPEPVPAGLRPGIVEPAEAIARFQRRGLLQPTFRWEDMWQEEHAHAFAAAAVTELDVLGTMRDEIDLAVREGRSLDGFRDAIREKLAKAGWWGDIEVQDPAGVEPPRLVRFDDRRLETIFDVNMRQSHAAGRWDRIWRRRQRFPLLMYRTMRDERVRASHARWDGLVLPVEHPFWRTHYPPNGWRCRCTAFALDERELQRRRDAGERIVTEAPDVEYTTFVNRRTGETLQVPVGIDPGFGYNPGMVGAREEHVDKLRQDRERGL